MTNGKTKSRCFLLCVLVLAVIIVPFVFFGGRMDAWTGEMLDSAGERGVVLALVLGGLLAADILIPVPSSVVSTACGLFFGFGVGTLVSLMGMTVSCVAGFWLGVLFGRPLAERMVGAGEMERLERMSRRFGDWLVVMARPVPVLAEASVIFAGIGRMRSGRFFLFSTLANVGISAAYAAIGAFSAKLNSFLLAFAGAILVPWLVMSAAGVYGRKRDAGA